MNKPLCALIAVLAATSGCNTESHIYHKEGSRFYGKTKKGKYVSEADAIKEGDKASKE